LKFLSLFRYSSSLISDFSLYKKSFEESLIKESLSVNCIKGNLMLYYYIVWLIDWCLTSRYIVNNRIDKLIL
jgi:hypothetical protein